jgi:fumarylpyruvate hydrolase
LSHNVTTYPFEGAGIRTRVIEAGTGEDAVLFLHGLGARADRFAKNLPAFAQAGFRGVAIDLPGHGFAQKDDNARFDPASMMPFLSSVLDGLGISRVTLVGTSYGGLLALNYAAACPERVKALVLIGSLGLAPLSLASRQRMARTVQAHSIEQTRSKLERLVFDSRWITDAWVEEECRINTSPGAAAALGRLTQFIEEDNGLASIDLSDTLATVAQTMPTALVWGTRDRSVPLDIGRTAWQRTPAATWIAIDDACHAPYFERSDLFNSTVLGFLSPSRHPNRDKPMQDAPMNFAIPAPAPSVVPVAGGDTVFPVRRIYCVGRNYADHMKEMGFGADVPSFFFFMKPADAIVPANATIDYPPGTRNLHYEIELVLAIGKAGRNIAPENALTHVFGYAVGNDLTRRDLQLAARDKGRPWEIGKAFDASAVVGTIHLAQDTGPLAGARIWLDVNGVRKQDAALSDMIFPLQDIIARLSELHELVPGDLIFTGTPAGVGPIQAGDVVTGGIDGLGSIETRVL